MSKKSTTQHSAKNNVRNNATLNAGELSLDNDQWITKALSTHLDVQADNLDFNVSSKLSAARYRALAQQPSSQSSTRSKASWFNWTTALGSTAVLALVFLVSVQFFPMNPSQPSELAQVVPPNQITQRELIEDLNLLSATDDIEFYQSVEFLEWLESNSG